MKLIISIPKNQETVVRQFLDDMERKGTPTEGVHCIDLKVNNCRTVSELRCSYAFLKVEGLVDFKEGDIVENTKSGNWGVVTSVNSSTRELTIRSSKKTREETGLLRFKSRFNESTHLI